MAHGKRGRHAPAFILLMLTFGPNHGLGIINQMDQLVPGHRLDTAGTYRVLKSLEKDGFIHFEWVESTAGPKKKVYHITDDGKKELEIYKEEVEFVVEKLKVFLKLYSDL